MKYMRLAPSQMANMRKREGGSRRFVMMTPIHHPSTIKTVQTPNIRRYNSSLDASPRRNFLFEASKTQITRKRTKNKAHAQATNPSSPNSSKKSLPIMPTSFPPKWKEIRVDIKSIGDINGRMNRILSILSNSILFLFMSPLQAHIYIFFMHTPVSGFFRMDIICFFLRVCKSDFPSLDPV